MLHPHNHIYDRGNQKSSNIAQVRTPPFLYSRLVQQSKSDKQA